jgi:hypothetical protein
MRAIVEDRLGPGEATAACRKASARWQGRGAVGSIERIRAEAKPVVVDVPARLVTVVKQSGAPDVQQFDVAAVNASIDRQVAVMKPEERVVAIGYVDRDGASVAVVGRLNVPVGDLKWTITGTRKWSGDWNAQAAFRWSL